MILKQKAIFRTPSQAWYHTIEYDATLGPPPGFTFTDPESASTSHYKYVGAQDGELIYTLTTQPEEPHE